MSAAVPFSLPDRAPPVLDVRIQFEPHLSMVRLTGELDIASAHLLLDAVGVITTTSTTEMVVLDLAGVTFCDVAGLRAIETCAVAADRAGTRLVLHQVPCLVRRLILTSAVTARLECR